MKILIIEKGHFYLTDEVVMKYLNLIGIEEASRTVNDEIFFTNEDGEAYILDYYSTQLRVDEDLIKLVEQDPNSKLKIVEVMDGIDFKIKVENKGEYIVQENKTLQ